MKAQMPAIPEIDPHVFSDAVRAFWDTRAAQAAAQELRGVSDQGTRGSVTGGKQLDGFVLTITQHMLNVGVRETDIYYGRQAELPGYFRAQKQWDIAVVRDDLMIAAIEFKSQVGSFGNNLNNRSEEAVGAAEDFWTAYREGAFGTSPQPWLGYMYVMQDHSDSIKPRPIKAKHFPVFPSFVTHPMLIGWSCCAVG